MNIVKDSMVEYDPGEMVYICQDLFSYKDGIILKKMGFCYLVLTWDGKRATREVLWRNVIFPNLYADSIYIAMDTIP
jgi:hypothetical protein